MPVTPILLALLAVALPVTEEDPAPARQSALYLEAGPGSPLGVIGIESVTRIAPWMEMSFGLGLGLNALESQAQPGPGHMLQWSLMPRLILGNSRTGGVTLGLGASGGNYGDFQFICFDSPCQDTFPVSYFVWGNVEVGVEAWTPAGLAVRFFGGYAHGWCASSPCVAAATDLPYLGAGVGYAF